MTIDGNQTFPNIGTIITSGSAKSTLVAQTQLSSVHPPCQHGRDDNDGTGNDQPANVGRLVWNSWRPRPGPANRHWSREADTDLETLHSILNKIKQPGIGA